MKKRTLKATNSDKPKGLKGKSVIIDELGFFAKEVPGEIVYGAKDGLVYKGEKMAEMMIKDGVKINWESLSKWHEKQNKSK